MLDTVFRKFIRKFAIDNYGVSACPENGGAPIHSRHIQQLLYRGPYNAVRIMPPLDIMRLKSVGTTVTLTNTYVYAHESGGLSAYGGQHSFALCRLNKQTPHCYCIIFSRRFVSSCAVSSVPEVTSARVVLLFCAAYRKS